MSIVGVLTDKHASVKYLQAFVDLSVPYYTDCSNMIKMHTNDKRAQFSTFFTEVLEARTKYFLKKKW